MGKRTYVLTVDNDTTVYPTRKEAQEAADKCGDDCHGFDSAETLEAVLTSGPATRAVEIWNALPGVEPVKGFKSKGQAASRIFKQLTGLGDDIQDGEETPEPVAAAVPAKPKKAKPSQKAARAAKPRKSAKTAKKSKRANKKARAGSKSVASKHNSRRTNASNGDSKKTQVIEMISKKGGATLESIMAGTGWQRHTCRGMLATLKTKGGLNVESFKTTEGERAYRIA